MVAALDQPGKEGGPVDHAWVAWAERLIALIAEGRVHPATARPLPAFARDELLGRGEQIRYGPLELRSSTPGKATPMPPSAS